MGRSRKPVAAQKGNLTVVNLQKRLTEEASVTADRSQIKRPPEWLIDEAAKKEWRRIVKELSKIELVGNLDKSNLGGYCNAFSQYKKATEELKDAELCVEKQTRTGAVLVRNPLIDIQKMYAEEMRKFASMCGLTIDSRLKAAASKTTEKEDILKGKFGI